MYDIILAFIIFCSNISGDTVHYTFVTQKNLMDEPGERRSHKVSTPPGRYWYFAGTLFSIIMWTPFNYFGELQYILCAFIIIFLIGPRTT
ncbi:MAG: hypothetical protein IPL08_12690 [Saprospiraceae bacterium]|nr:hypothetical protein [Saprospiraceae bacterium]